MGKISPVSAKYIVTASIEIDGMVDKPDVIGAVFGQTEGLLGADLELRELQRSGRIGRIEVNIETKNGKSQGEVIIPSSLDKAETAIVAAALEVIQRIGPCNSIIHVKKIDDIRISKRKTVIARAKELLKAFLEDGSPDSQELADEVSHAVRVMEITEYGTDRVPAGPMVSESEEIIVVEGRADVLNLLKHGIKNAIAVGGTGVPKTVLDLTREKIVTVFVDGDRGGDLIIKELLDGGSIDFITKAPDGKEVEEITKKEIHQALRNRVAAEQYVTASVPKREPVRNSTSRTTSTPVDRRARERRPADDRRSDAPVARAPPEPRASPVNAAQKTVFKKVLDDLVGTKGAFILDNDLQPQGKVPAKEVEQTLKSLGRGRVYAVIIDGDLDKNMLSVAERQGVKCLVGRKSEFKGRSTVAILTTQDLE